MNSDGSCDSAIVEDAIAKFSSKTIIINKSTVPPGTTERFDSKYKNFTECF